MRIPRCKPRSYKEMDSSSFTFAVCPKSSLVNSEFRSPTPDKFLSAVSRVELKPIPLASRQDSYERRPAGMLRLVAVGLRKMLAPVRRSLDHSSKEPMFAGASTTRKVESVGTVASFKRFTSGEFGPGR